MRGSRWFLVKLAVTGTQGGELELLLAPIDEAGIGIRWTIRNNWFGERIRTLMQESSLFFPHGLSMAISPLSHIT